MGDIWDQVAASSVNDRGNYFAEGEYDVVIESAKTKQGFKGHSVIFSFRLLSSDNPDAPAGEYRDWVLNLSGPNGQLAFGNIKGMVCAIMHWSKEGSEHNAELAEILRRMTTADNILAEMPVHLSCFMTKTRAGGDFTVHKFEPYRTDGYQPRDPLGATKSAAFAPPTSFAAAPPPPPPARPANLPPQHLLPDGRWWDGTQWRA